MKKNIRYITAAGCALAMVLGLAACGTDTPNVITPTPASTEAPTATETPAVTEEIIATDAPEATEAPAATETPTPTEDPRPTADPSVTEDSFNTADFFADAVYCGDSLMNFYQWRGNSYKNSTAFGPYVAKNWLVLNSFSCKTAINEEATESDPSLNGEHVKLWNAIPTLGKSRVFMFFGLNDIGITGVDKFIENYETLINRIQDSTDYTCKFYILSITPMREDSQSSTGLNNEKIMEANSKLQDLCKECGYTYVDVASKLRDAGNNLILTNSDGEKISDGTNVHITSAGYVYWDEAMLKLAKSELYKEYLESVR